MERLRERLEKTDLKKTFTSDTRTCNYPWCIHIRTWLDERGVCDSRYVIGKGKRMVIIDLFQQHAAACRGGNMPTLTSASVWQVGGLCAGQSYCILVPSHPWCFQNMATNIDRGNPIPRPSPAVALSTVLLHPRDICLVRCQTCCMQDNWVVLSLPHDRWQSTKILPVTLKALP